MSGLKALEVYSAENSSRLMMVGLSGGRITDTLPQRDLVELLWPGQVLRSELEVTPLLHAPQLALQTSSPINYH